MVDENALQHWRDALAEQPSGWDFSSITGYREEQLPWRWETQVENLAAMADRVLDLGTGGGEMLAQLAPLLPDGTLATEGWDPNLPIARERLAPLGIEVVRYDADQPGALLPVEAGAFDLILARHEPYDPAEIARVLRPDGVLLTQQVGTDDLHEIRAAFGMPPHEQEVSLESAVRELTAAGLRVDRAEPFHGHYEFDDVPSMLAYLRRVPWDAPADLDVDRHREVLESLYEQMRHGPLSATLSRFQILARAPQAPDEGRTDFSALLGEDLDVPQV